MASIPPVLLDYIEGLKTHDVPRIAGTVSEDLSFVLPERTLDKARFLDMLRALYAAFPDWRYGHDPPENREHIFAIKWRQSGTHSGTLAIPELDPVPATGRAVVIPEQYFFYKVRGERIVEIRPDPVPGGAPGGILEQLGGNSAEL